jgi:hypothetical protein
MPLEWDYPVFKRIMGRIRAIGQPSQLPPITMPLRRRRVKMAMRMNQSSMYTSQRLERPRRMYASQKRQAVRRSPKEEFINELPCKDSEGITEEDLDMMWKYASHIANALGISVDEIDKNLVCKWFRNFKRAFTGQASPEYMEALIQSEAETLTSLIDLVQ